MGLHSVDQRLCNVTHTHIIIIIIIIRHQLGLDRRASSLSNGKGKGKVHPCTGTEALYRPYGPQGE